MTQSLGRSRAAVVMAFVVCGMMFGSWASRIPAIKDQAGLDSVQLGFALLGSPLGSVLAMTFAGYAAGRYRRGGHDGLSRRDGGATTHRNGGGCAGLRVALGMILALLIVLAATAGRAVGSSRVTVPEPTVPMELP